MGATVTPNAAEGPSLPCRICGRSAPRGAKLCNQCRAAVQRARHTRNVVSEYLPSTPATTHSLRGLAIDRPRPVAGVQLDSSLPPGAWGACAAIIVFGTAMALTGYFAVKEIDDESGPVMIAAEPATTVQDAASAKADEIPPSSPAVDPPPVQAEHPEVATPPPKGVKAPRSPARAASDSKASRLSRSAQQSQLAYSSARAAPTITQEAAVEATSSPALKPIESEPVVPDRWQSMHAALAGCSRQSFLAGIVCDERTRWQYCVGYWGKVPECPAAAQLGTTGR